MRRKAKQKQSADILIVGGGPSGLVLAAALGAAGFDVLCLERSAQKAQRQSRPDGRTLALSFRSVDLCRQTGLWPLIEKDAAPILDIRVADQDSPSHLHFRHREAGGQPFGWIIETHLFHRALQKRIAQLQTVRMVYGAHIASIENGPARAAVKLEDGRIFSASLIAAADGRNSWCRTQAAIPVYGWAYKQTAIVCIIRHEKPHHHVAVEHFQPGGPFAVLPMTGQRSSIVWTEKTAAADALMAMDEESFTELLQSRIGDYLGEVGLAGARFSYPLQLQHARSYVGERLVLIGDAAHGIHPIAGQGFNLGMGDIETLVDRLTEAASLGLDPGDAELLRRYEQSRKFDNGNMVLMTDLLDRLFSNSVPAVQAARRFGLGAVQSMPRLKRFFMRTAMGRTINPRNRHAG